MNLHEHMHTYTVHIQYCAKDAQIPPGRHLIGSKMHYNNPKHAANTSFSDKKNKEFCSRWSNFFRVQIATS